MVFNLFPVRSVSEEAKAAIFGNWATLRAIIENLLGNCPYTTFVPPFTGWPSSTFVKRKSQESPECYFGG